MTTLKVKDLVVNLGNLGVYDAINIILIFIITMILLKMLLVKLLEIHTNYKEHTKFVKSMNNIVDSINDLRDIKDKKKCPKIRFKQVSLEDRGEELWFEFNEPIKKGTTWDKSKPKPETKPKVEEEEEIVDDTIMKEKLWKDNKESVKSQIKIRPTRMWMSGGKRASTDRQDHPEIFNRMMDLATKLIRVLWVVWLSKSVWVTAASISWVTSNKITTMKTASNYIKKFEEVLADMPNIDDMPDFFPAWPTNKIAARVGQDKISEIERIELNRLIDALLNKITQKELAGRMWLSQPQVSDISRRKVTSSYTAKMYIKKLQWIERMLLGAHISNSQL